MVTLAQAESSNRLVSTALPPHLVAVFVGATKGIGLASLKAFVKHARQPRVYFIGRSKDIGERVAKECEELNPDGEYIFLEKDVSLIKNVDEVCKEIRKREEVINLLFQTQGTLRMGIGEYMFSFCGTSSWRKFS
jgi:NADP-dependent 3-hydroxy acid dehydrogenase YdfG